MPDLESMPRQRRSSGRKWPRWLRNSRLLKWALFVAVMVYRLWKWWHSLAGSPDG